MNFYISSFYKFFDIPASRLPVLKCELEEFAEGCQLQGLLILAEEGMNGTVAGSKNSVLEFKTFLSRINAAGTWDYKDSCSEKDPFKRFKVKIREQIVTSGDAVSADTEKACYLSPQEWHEALLNWDDAVVIDTRNAYETELGIFRGALDPGLVNFQEFTEFVEHSRIPKDKKVLMYCTGGIRCEKASVEMKRRGYEEVYQLKGGILKYLEEIKDGLFDGECFVFDQRVSLDKELQASKTYCLCPHCGNPGKLRIACRNCGAEAVVCEGCRPLKGKETCSKDCSYQLLRKKASA